MNDIDKPKRTKLTIREDSATAVSSTQHGHNLDAIGFNLTLLAKHDLSLAQQVASLYEKVRILEATVPGTVRHSSRRPHDPPDFDD